MFLRESLLLLSGLMSEYASIQLELARCAEPAVTALRTDDAHKATARARLLFGLAELATSIDDNGPAVPELVAGLGRLRRAIDEVRGLVGGAAHPEVAGACLRIIDDAGLEPLHAALLEAAEPELIRVLRLMDAEISRWRRRRRSAACSCQTPSHVPGTMHDAMLGGSA